MKAALLVGPKQIQIIETPIPEPKKGELRIKLTEVGICGSDVHLFLGHRQLSAPTIIGHEGIGIIDKIGDGVMDRSIGERVVIEPNIPCRYCASCMKGEGRNCENKRVLGITESGCFAEYICIPELFCWTIPDSISNEDAVTIEPMAVALHALFSAGCKPGDTIAVVGLGAIGLLLTHLALALGYQVVVTEKNELKINIAISQGAIHCGTSGELQTQIEALSVCYQQFKPVAIFECAGIAQTATLVAAAAPRGSKIVLLGISENQASFTPLKIVREGISIVPSLIYDHPFDFKRTIQLIRSKLIQPGFIISKYTDLPHLQEALHLAVEGAQTKLVVNI